MYHLPGIISAEQHILMSLNWFPGELEMVKHDWL